MDRQLSEWKLGIERIWSATAPDYGEAARLAADIASVSEEAILRQAAMQALPSLRKAARENDDRNIQAAARRRLGLVRDTLIFLTAPRFGKRQDQMKSPTPEERYRELLGLPLGCHLSGAEIRQAYKRAAKTAHPDAGGTAQQFLQLSEAREALIKETWARRAG
jgi:hypothetical protein